MVLSLALSGCVHASSAPEIKSWDLVAGRGIVTLPIDFERREPEPLVLRAGLNLVRAQCNSSFTKESDGFLVAPAPLNAPGSSVPASKYFIVFSCSRPLRARVTGLQRIQMMNSQVLPAEVKQQLLAADPEGFRGARWGALKDVVEDALDDAGLESRDEGSTLTTTELVGAVSMRIRRSFQNGVFALVELFASPSDQRAFIDAAHERFGAPDRQEDAWDVYEFATSIIMIARVVPAEPAMRVEALGARGNASSRISKDDF